MFRKAVLALGFMAIAVTPGLAEEVATVELTLTKDTFTPAEVRVAANQPFVIKFKNANAVPAELEAKDLDIEKVAPGGADIVVRVKAMKPGKYLFVDEFQEDVAKGYVIVE